MTSFQTLAVGYDDSPDARAALRWALRLAKEVDAEVMVVHATGLLEHAREEGVAQSLTATVRRLAHEVGIDPERVRLNISPGDPCSVLHRATQSPIDADMLVVGTRGEGARSGYLLGSTSLELAEHATVPLVIVPWHQEEQ
ncbi:MAG TPA: universal stress protein [Acidimicrobiales bacterium]|nr:universal stress protein [Acidimicrobiales bacterium]